MCLALKMLDDISRHGLRGVDPEHIIFIAKAVWYYELIPDLGQMAGPHRGDAGYLLDCLARFSALPKEQKLRLIAALEPYRPLSASTDSGLHDPRAKSWHASCDITPFLADILPFQTRHYASGFGW